MLWWEWLLEGEARDMKLKDKAESDAPWLLSVSRWAVILVRS
jgi:hypothetical protein